MRWTVNQRIAAGFGILLFLLLLVGSIGYAAARSAAGEFESAVARQRTSARVTELLTEFNAANLAFVRYLLAPDERWLSERERLLTRLRAGVQEEARTSTSTAERRDWQEAVAQIDEWERASDLSISALQQGRRDEAIRIRETSALPASQRFSGSLGRVAAEHARAANQSSAAAIRDAEGSQQLILISTLVALLLGAASAVLLSRAVTRPLAEATTALATTAAELAAATAQQASGSSEAGAALTETAATVDEVAQTAEQAAEHARFMAESAERATTISVAGREAVDNSIASMEQTRHQVESIARSIVSLAEQAQAIGDIISTVDDIATQTNLLALNAAIEASRAGEYGRGFTVVAGEVRNLADQSKRATVEVRRILGEIQQATSRAVMTTEEGTKLVAVGSRRVAEAGETIRELSDTVAEASRTAIQITASSGQQSIGMSQIRQAMRQIQEASQQNLTAVRQTEQAARSLEILGTQLQALVGSGNGIVRRG